MTTKASKTCEVLSWVGGGIGDRVCGNPATYICDKGKKYQMYMCDECAKHAHPTRITAVSNGLDIVGAGV